MSAKKFKFISPGVFLNEIDNSQLPKAPGGVGPVIIGRARRGPALKPVKVSSFQEFVEIFGEPLPGNEGSDPWREGNGLLAPGYGTYATQAYLSADINSPVTFIRLLGVQGDDASDTGQAGWSLDTGNAFGLFFMHSGSSAGAHNLTAHLGAIVYTDAADFSVGVKGQTLVSGSSSIITSVATRGADSTEPVKLNGHEFTVVLSSSSGAKLERQVTMREGANYIRDRLNTNPVATNDKVMSPPAPSLAASYWLGETFDEEYERLYTSSSTGLCVFAAKLADNSEDFKSVNHQLAAAASGWVIPQNPNSPDNFVGESLEKMFRFHAIQEGESGMNLSISIENIKIADPGSVNPYGRFDVVVRQRLGRRIVPVDSFENLNLNPNSSDFIARRIGDQYLKWDTTQKRNRVYGSFPNQSNFIRVEMSLDVLESGPSNPSSVPFGFLGPIVPQDIDSTAAHFGDENSSKRKLPFGNTWVTGSLIVDTNPSSVSLKWAQMPHVVSGSRANGLGAGYILGHAEYNKLAGSGSGGRLNYSSVNVGAKDFLRRFSTVNNSSLVGEQISGIASTGKHSYVFSLDSVVVSGATALSNEMSSFVPTAVDFISGSSISAAASAVLTFASAPDTNEKLTITDSADNSVEFTFTRLNSNVTNNEAGTETDVGLQGVTANMANCAARIKTAIEGTNLRVSVSQTDGVLTITQTDPGPAGNKAIGNTPAVSGLSIPGNKFAGGFNGTAFTATLLDSSNFARNSFLSASALLEVVDGFTMPMVAGFDGVDVTEADPFNMRIVNRDSTTRNSYAHASIDRAIELIKDPEFLEMNLATIPGVSNESLTTKLVQTCEARGDSLAVIDLPNIYVPPSEQICSTFEQRVNNTNPAKSAKALTARQINSSYGATYYPWVKVRDTISARDVWVPPSVIALGVMAYTEERNEVWFAPAGFNRGGLNEGNAGLPVLQASEQLLSADRDRLYEANINPIASFVSEGLVVFGQKTLQMTPSALDRINVRRLLIFVKREVSRIANTLLFDQNVQATWNRFTGQVVPFLESVKTRLGLTDFKVILDSTTTTPDLIDRNIMYAKIFLKPARAIEFIAVDFVITRTGASFDD